MSGSILEELRKERKAGIKSGDIPEWYTTGGYQLFKNSYQFKNETVKEAYERVADAAANVLPWSVGKEEWKEKFFQLMWKGWLAPSTPVFANMGTDRGCAVSCSGSFTADDVPAFYEVNKEIALLSKNGFGTSAYLGAIRPRGASISNGGKASGVTPVLEMYTQTARDISQGGVRRGSVACYLEIDHPDFMEVCMDLHAEPDDKNIGWNLTSDFIERWRDGDPDCDNRMAHALWVKAHTGKGYFVKPDTMNDANPPMYEEHGLSVKASNLCTEICLHSDEEHTFTCVLSSMNLAKYDEWKNTDAVFEATVFLDCVAEVFILQGREIEGLEKAVRFTEKSRALGLGALGYHTYLQSIGVAFEELQAQFINNEIFKHLNAESLRASEWMAEELGEPEWCVGFGVRNTHRLAIAPNTSSALLCGGVSQGIEPVVANVYNQPSAAGEIKRVSPEFLKLAKKRGKFTEALKRDIIDHKGSVQHLDWLSDHEKLVFKTAYEIDQKVIIRQASQRQGNIDQGQSLNLFFDADEDESYILAIHKEAILDKNIKALYYMRTMAGVQASKDCVACEG